MRLFLLLLFFGATALADDYPGAPASVVAAYLEADGAGLALDQKTISQVLRFTTWKDAPGWDSFVVIRSYTIGEIGWTGREASVAIRFEVLGSVEGLAFTLKPCKEDVSFDLVKRKDAWKIVRPTLPTHLFVPAAIKALETADAKRNAAGQASLEKLRALKLGQTH